MAYKETLNKFYLHPSNLCSHLLLLLLFFQIACGIPLYTLRFSNICLQGDVSVPNRWPSFYTRTILQTLKGPPHTLGASEGPPPVIWNLYLQKEIWMAAENVNYGKRLIFNYRWLLSVHSCSTVDWFFLLCVFFPQHLIGAENSMTYFVWRECILYLCFLRRWPWA